MTEYKAIKVNGKKCDEHRYVMEQYLGRKLAFDEVFHHINGYKRDNRISNLELRTRADHSREHMTGRTLSSEAKDKLKSARCDRANDWLRGFTVDQISDIRERAANGESARQISRLYGVHHSTIQDVVARRTYADIQ